MKKRLREGSLFILSSCVTIWVIKQEIERKEKDIASFYFTSERERDRVCVWLPSYMQTHSMQNFSLTCIQMSSNLVGMGWIQFKMDRCVSVCVSDEL